MSVIPKHQASIIDDLRDLKKRVSVLETIAPNVGSVIESNHSNMNVGGLPYTTTGTGISVSVTNFTLARPSNMLILSGATFFGNTPATANYMFLNLQLVGVTTAANTGINSFGSGISTATPYISAFLQPGSYTAQFIYYMQGGTTGTGELFGGAIDVVLMG